MSHSVSYVNDTLVYMADVQQSPPSILKVLENFGNFSEYKVNLSKLALMLNNTDKNNNLSLLNSLLIMRSCNWVLKLVCHYHLWLKQIA